VTLFLGLGTFKGFDRSSRVKTLAVALRVKSLFKSKCAMCLGLLLLLGL